MVRTPTAQSGIKNVSSMAKALTEDCSKIPLVETRAIRWLLLGYCLFILYGTFIPFRFSSDPEFVHLQWAHFFGPLFANGVKQFSTPDVVSNLLLFVPFGFLWVGSQIGRPIVWRLFGASFGLACFGFMFGLAIEVGQIFSPGRTASILDALCNGFGAGIGGSLGYVALRAFTGSFGAALKNSVRDRPSVIVLAILIAAFVTDAYYPFEITIDVSTVWESFKQIHWQPFVDGPHRAWTDLVVNKIFFLAAIAYLLTINLQHENVPAPHVSACCLSIMLVPVVEAAKLFFAGRVPNIENVILCAAGALLGAFGIAPMSATAFVRRHSMVILIVLVLGLDVYSELSPFDWVWSHQELQSRLANIEWVPFAAYFNALPQAVIFDLGKKFFLVGPLGFLVGLRNFHGRLLAGWVGLVIGTILEACQVALRSRTASITDVLIFGVAAWSGAVVAQKFSRISESQPPNALASFDADHV